MTQPTNASRQGYEPIMVEVDRPTAESADYSGTEARPRPNDSDVERTLASIRKARAILTPIMGLAGWRISWVYQRDRFSEEGYSEAPAWVAVEWPYMMADVHISLPMCYDYDEDDLFRMLAHELAHCLVQPLVDQTEHTKEKPLRPVTHAMERLTQQIAWAVCDAFASDPENPEPPEPAFIRGSPAPEAEAEDDPWAIC